VSIAFVLGQTGPAPTIDDRDAKSVLWQASNRRGILRNQLVAKIEEALEAPPPDTEVRIEEDPGRRVLLDVLEEMEARNEINTVGLRNLLNAVRTHVIA
jgi:hypothetical protein